MASSTTQLIVPGIPVPSPTDPRLDHFLKITPVSSHLIIPGRAAVPAAIAQPVSAADDSIVHIEYESGISEFLRADQFAREIGPSRAGGPVMVPFALNRGATTRGAADWILKGLHIFNISPVDALAHETAAAVVNHFDGQIKAGLYRLKEDGEFGEPITQPINGAGPYLIFIHGTASSTSGSFSGLWKDDTGKHTPEWNQLVSKYGKRILALEHRTFSVSPVQNALDLATLLPQKAEVHIITHSRGGLVGELLGLGSLKQQELSAFDGRPDADLLKELSNLLGKKKLNISKFVRTACPAAGTILASKRMDLYLNIILNVIGHIPLLEGNPLYALFKATALELIKLKADPKEIPGIEAQMPESPLIHLLNTGRETQADLGVIAGDFEGSGFWGKLKEYALRAYYWQDNDFVVNTRSMSGGMHRAKGVWQFLDQGDTVNHFHYFKNERTRSRMLKWLNEKAPDTDFVQVQAIQAAAPHRGIEERDVAILIPDAFGTELKIGAVKIWPDYDALAQGRFKDLAAANVQPGELLDVYKTLRDALVNIYDVVEFAYDWRKSISDSAAKLQAKIKTSKTTRAVHFVAHGMGGLIFREWVHQNPDTWKTFRANNSRALMLGTPQSGSWHIARLLAGQTALINMLALLGRDSTGTITQVFQGFQGFIEMLPQEAQASTFWSNAPMAPDRQMLAGGAAWRKQLETTPLNPDSMFLVQGSAAATPSGLEEYTSDGDGQVTYESAGLGALKCWYNLQKQHGELPDDPSPFLEILARGTTSALATGPGVRRPVLAPERLLAEEQSVLFPSQLDLVNQALGRTERGPSPDTASALNVTVVHGHLREASHPVVVGHYIGDGIVSAEAELDRQLNKRLSARFYMDLYPGEEGTVELIHAPDGHHPPGAVVIGLGEVGEINQNKVCKAAMEACLRYALAISEDPLPEGKSEHSAALTFLLIGVAGGRSISIADSVTAIVRGALEANRVLRRNLNDKVRVDQIEFIELYENAAIEAAHVAAALPERLRSELQAQETVKFNDILQTREGGRFRQPLNIYDSGWWRRILICEKEQCQSENKADQSNETSAGTCVPGNAQSSPADAPATCGASPEKKKKKKTSIELTYEALTDRARSEQTTNTSQISLLSALLAKSRMQSAYDADSAVSLFELLVPNILKDQAQDADLVLVVDSVAAQYPWELMALRTQRQTVPLSVKVGMVRQFRTARYRGFPRGARERNALVVGDTQSGYNKLPGAQAEAGKVAQLLGAAGYTAPPLIALDGPAIIQKLFNHDYKILHIAAHGVYNPDDPASSGVVLGKNIFLTSLELEKLRNLPDLVFLNCCYLATIDSELLASAPHALAASVAQQLIEMGVKAVVAAGWAVDDSAAVVFAETFYRRMLAGEKFGAAVKAARQAAHDAGSTNTWGAYQCYGNPDFALETTDGAATDGFAFYSRREYFEELKDIAAKAKGAPGAEIKRLAQRVRDLEKAAPAAVRDAELLFRLGEAYKAVKDFERGIAAYEDALQYEKAAAPVESAEQLANLLDRQADRLCSQAAATSADKARAQKMWDRAEKLLIGLKDTLGESGERLSLLGALYKRRAGSYPQPAQRKRSLALGAKYYRKAYDHKRQTQGAIDYYSGLNWITLAYVSGSNRDALAKQGAEECFADCKVPKQNPTYWDRSARPDAALLEALLDKNLKTNLANITSLYQEALQHAAASDRDSTLSQLEFIQKMKPDPALKELIQRLAKET